MNLKGSIYYHLIIPDCIEDVCSMPLLTCDRIIYPLEIALDNI